MIDDLQLVFLYFLGQPPGPPPWIYKKLETFFLMASTFYIVNIIYIASHCSWNYTSQIMSFIGTTQLSFIQYTLTNSLIFIDSANQFLFFFRVFVVISWHVYGSVVYFRGFAPFLLLHSLLPYLKSFPGVIPERL